MNIEAGKLYKTRHGMKARIYATDAEGNFPVHGAISDDGGNIWQICYWTAAGNCSLDGSMNSRLDLVAEWEEPRPRLLAWMDTAKDCGAVYLLDSRGPVRNSLMRAPWLDEPEGSAD